MRTACAKRSVAIAWSSRGGRDRLHDQRALLRECRCNPPLVRPARQGSLITASPNRGGEASATVAPRSSQESGAGIKESAKGAPAPMAVFPAGFRLLASYSQD
jgi:hypothetical protein